MKKTENEYHNGFLSKGEGYLIETHSLFYFEE